MRRLVTIVAAALMLAGQAPASLVQAVEPVASGVLFLESEPGDYIGQGQTQQFTSLDGKFSVTRNPNNGISINFSSEPSTWWNVHFAAPQNTPLEVGTFENATRWPFQTSERPGLDFSTNGRGCNTSSGQFQVLDIAYAPTGEINRFAADFTQHCEGFSPALTGRVLFIYN